MAELKTKETRKSVEKFLKSIKDDTMRNDCFMLMKFMKQVTKAEPKMWGTSIVGFGQYHYKGKSGREGDWFLTGFSPRKDNLTLYLMGGLDKQAGLLKKLGKHKKGMGCLYIKSLEVVDMPFLKKLIKASVDRIRAIAREQSSRK